jgi:hypothetical protein
MKPRKTKNPKTTRQDPMAAWLRLKHAGEIPSTEEQAPEAAPQAAAAKAYQEESLDYVDSKALMKAMEEKLKSDPQALVDSHPYWKRYVDVKYGDALVAKARDLAAGPQDDASTTGKSSKGKIILSFVVGGLLVWGPLVGLVIDDKSYEIEHYPARIVANPGIYAHRGYFYPLIPDARAVKAAVQKLLEKDPNVLVQHASNWMPYYEDQAEAGRLRDLAVEKAGKK